MKFDIFGFYEPTPERVRKVGDFLQYGSQVLASTQISENPKISMVIIIIGSVGKILSNFFVESDK